MDQHKNVLDEAKSEYEKLKKAVDELRASEVVSCSGYLCIFVFKLFAVIHYTTKWYTVWQVDAEYKLQDMKKAYKDLENKGKAYKRKLDDLQAALSKHIEQ